MAYREDTKNKVIRYHLKYPHDPIDTIAFKFKCSRTLVKTIIDNFNSGNIIYKPLNFCFSLSSPKYVGYLFDNFSEREVIIHNRKVVNSEMFTDHELNWLKINYNLFA